MIFLNKVHNYHIYNSSIPIIKICKKEYTKHHIFSILFVTLQIISKNTKIKKEIYPLKSLFVFSMHLTIGLTLSIFWLQKHAYFYIIALKFNTIHIGHKILILQLNINILAQKLLGCQKCIILILIYKG